MQTLEKFAKNNVNFCKIYDFHAFLNGLDDLTIFFVRRIRLYIPGRNFPPVARQ